MANAYPILVLAPVVGLLAYCVSHILLARWAYSQRPYPALMLGFVSGLIGVAAVSAAALAAMQSGIGDVLGYGTLNLLTYLALAFGYFNFINLNIASLRIRMLHELWQSDGGLTKEELLSRYNTDDVIATRIARLTRGGHLVEREGRLYSGRLRFLVVARIFDLLRWFILGAERSEQPVADQTPSGEMGGK